MLLSEELGSSLRALPRPAEVDLLADRFDSFKADSPRDCPRLPEIARDGWRTAQLVRLAWPRPLPPPPPPAPPPR